MLPWAYEPEWLRGLQSNIFQATAKFFGQKTAAKNEK